MIKKDVEKKKFFLGIDDAGRGPVVGSMVLAGCLVDSETESEFKKIGIKDSKQLTQKRREFFEKIIKEKSKDFQVLSISSKEIDKSNSEGLKLNELEAIYASKIINRINKGDSKIKVVLDCPSTSIIKWRDFLKMNIENLSNLEVICEHKADKNHVSVSAASILAKSEREREMKKLRKKHGEDIGSGYPSDPKTKNFLEKNIKNKDYDDIFRKSWATWKNANKKSEQKKLF